jgi:hypothetical protein
MFAKTSSLGWNDVLALAERFAERIRAVWPEFYEEMEGMFIPFLLLQMWMGWRGL